MRRPADRALWLVALVAVGIPVGACVSISLGPPQASRAGTASPSAQASPLGGSAGPSVPGATADVPGATSTPTAQPAPAASTLAPAPSVRLGYISLDERVPFARSVSAGVREAAAQAGAGLIECDSGLTPQGTLECGRQLGEAGVDAVISFGGFPELGAELCQAMGGVPAVGVVFDQGPCQVTRVGIDNTGSGRLAGEALGRFARERWDCAISAYVSLESSAAGPDGAARMAGFRDGFSRHCAFPADGARVIEGADRVATARNQVARLLEVLPGRRIVVVGLNEDAIRGAMAAARSAGREGDLYYAGQGADPSMRREIACDERYVASVAHFPERFGAILVPAALEALAGRSPAPSIAGPLRLVTAKDIREVYPDTPPCDPQPSPE